MNITAIRASNFRSWPSVELAIEPGVTLLAGPNGSGKTSLIDGLLFAMYGVSQNAANLIQRGADLASVAIDVHLERGDVLTIERTIRRSGASATIGLKVWLDGEDISGATVGESQKAIDQFLVPEDVLRASAFSTQHGGAAFTEASPRDRKRIFASILDLGMWDVLAEQSKSEKRAADDAAALARGELERLDGAGERLLAARQRENEAGAAFAEAQAAEAIAIADADELATQAEAAREARRQHAAAVESEQRARADHQRATQERASADEALASAKAAAANAPDIERARQETHESDLQLAEVEAEQTALREASMKWSEQFSEAEREVANEQAKLNVALQDIARHEASITAEASGECSRCGAPETAWKASPLEAARTALAAAKAAEIDAREGIESWVARRDYLKANSGIAPDDAKLRIFQRRAQEAQAAVARAETTQALAGSIETAQQRARDAADYEAEMAAALRICQSKIEPLAAAVEASAEAESWHVGAVMLLDAARSAHNAAAADLARAEEAAKLAERQALEETAARERLEAAELDAAIAGILAAGFGPQGVPAMIVDGVLGDLADEANRVLAELASPIRVDLRSQRVTQKGDLVDALEIIVQMDALEAPYETLSGGERTRVALALRAALTRLLASKRGARVRLLVADEPSGLDASGSEAFADVLGEFVRAGIFDSCIVITHDERLADRIERVVRVEKDSAGVSRLAASPAGSPSPQLGDPERIAS